MKNERGLARIDVAVNGDGSCRAMTGGLWLDDWDAAPPHSMTGRTKPLFNEALEVVRPLHNLVGERALALTTSRVFQEAPNNVREQRARDAYKRPTQ
jgi:hypothetical protein